MKKLLLFLSVAFGFLLLRNTAGAQTITYSSPNIFTVGVAVNLTPTASGGVANSVLRAGGGRSTTLPGGLTLNANGTITGTPTTVTATTNYGVTARVGGTNGVNSNTFTIQIVAAATLSYASPAAYTPNVAITPLSPTSSGVNTFGFGTGATLTGATLNSPYGMAIDPVNNNIYAANYNNNTISYWNSAGTYQSTFGTGLSRPVGLVFDGSGNAYILDQGTGTNNGKVVKIGPTGTVLSTSYVPTTLNAATAIAIDASGNLYVVDSGAGKIYQYSSAGVLLQTITDTHTPENVAVDVNGNIYVLDNGGFGNRQLVKYNSAGTIVGTPVTALSNNPLGLSIDASGNIYIGNNNTDDVTVYNSGGTLLTTITGNNNPEGMVVDSQGNLYVSNFGNNTVVKYPPVGGYHLSGTLPPGLSFDPTTGTVSGTPTTSFGSTTYTVTAYNAAGTAVTATFTISCSLPAPILAYAGTPYSFITGISNTTATITNTGGAVSGNYTLTITSGSLPAGITFDITTGTFTVAPTVAGSFTGNVTASNSGGGGSAPISMTVTDPAAPNISYSNASYVVTYGTTINDVISNTGGPVASYAVTSGTLPIGLTLNTSTGAITGVPSVTAVTSVTITATNAGGTSPATVSFTVNPAALTIAATGPLKPYGTALTAGSSTINFTATGLVNSETVSSVTLTPDANGLSATTAAGQPYVVTPSAATGGGTFNVNNYTITYTPYNGTVTAEPLTIKANNQTKAYGTTFTFAGTEFTITSGTLAPGDAITSVTLASAGAASNASVAGSPYTIVPTAAVGSGLSNYAITYSNGTMTVTKDVITISATGPSKPYGTALASGTYTTNFAVTSGTLAPGDAITSVFLTMNANAQSTTRAAGLSYTVTPSGQVGLTAGNYTITYAPLNGTVTPAPLTVTASTNNKPYGTTLTGGAITTGFTYSGQQNGNTVTGVTAAYGTGSTATAALGSYPGQITISAATGGNGFLASNYTITYVPGDIVVGQGTLTITANSVTKTFGTTLTGGAGSTAFGATGLAPGETVGSVTITYGTGAAAGDPVATYTNSVVPSAATGGTFNPANYNIVYVDGNITVNPQPPVLSYTNPAPYTVGTAIPSLGPPTNTGGTVAPPGTYSPTTILSGSDGLNNPYGMAVDAAGNLYVANFSGNSIVEYSTTGTVTTYTMGAGTGPVGIVFDSSGNAYVLDQTSKQVVKFAGGNLSGAGTALTGLGLSTTATGIAIDGSNNLYIADSGNNNIKKYSGGTVTTIGPATVNILGFPVTIGHIGGGIAVDASGNIYVADNDYGDFGLGGGVAGIDEYNSSGTFTVEHQFGTTISGISIDNSGNIYVTDTGAKTMTEYSSNLATTILTESGFNSPRGVVSDGKGDFFISDYSANTVTEYAPTGGYSLTGTLPPGLSFNTTTGVFTGTPQTVFGPLTLTVTGYNAGGSGSTTVTISCVVNPPVISYTPSVNVYPVGAAITPLAPAVSGGPLAAAGYNAGTSFATGLNQPWGLFTDASGNIWVGQNGVARVTKYTPAGVATNFTVAATGNTGVVVDASGKFYVSNSNGDVYTYSAAGVLQNTNTTARNNNFFNQGSLDGIAIDASGNLYFTDVTEGFVWKYTASTGVTSQLIVTGSPVGITVDPNGNIYVVDQGTSKAIKEYNSSGTYEATIASGFTTPYSIYRDAKGDLYIGDSGTNTIKEYNVLGTLIGSTAATNPRGVTMDASGNLYASNYTAGTITKYAPYYYVLSGGALPAGLTFDTTTGTFSGTPTATFATTVFTITAYGSDGGPATTTVTITCAYPPSFTYTSPQTYTDGTPIPTLNPIFAIPNGGGPLTSASVTTNGPLPPGLTLNADGSITGTPTTVNGPVTYTITGTNAAGLTGTATVTITCNPALPNISYTTPDVYNVGIAIAPALTPTNTGGAVATWSITPGLPPGINFDTTTGIISGTPTAVSPAINYLVTATNVTGSATFTVNISVQTDAPVITYATPDVYTVGSIITPLVPNNTGGAVATWAISPGLPAGLNFDTTTGIITGTPTTPSPATNYTVTATNPGGSGMFVINITVNVGGPVFSYLTPDIFPVGTAITPLSPTNTGTAPTGYAISPGLPAGLNFDTTTGIISGTPSVTSPATLYTVTATDASSNTGTATISIACSGYVDWIGVTSTDWNDATNWATGAVPTATDIAGIGVNQTFDNFPNVLAGSGTINVGSVVIGTSSTQVSAVSTTAQAGGFVVNAGSTLNLSGAITYQSDANSGLGLTATISGAGTVAAAGINVTANTTLGVPAAYTQTLATSVASMSLTSSASLTSTVDASSNALNAAFKITGGTVSVAGTIQTSNGATSTSTLAVIPGTTATLQLAGASALAGLSGTGTNVISFNNPGATIEYSGAGQTYYTDAAINGLPGGESYNSIKFSGTGVKSPNGTNANNLLVSGDFTNALTTNDATDYIDLSTPNVNFNGITQNIVAGNGTGTKFYNVTFSGTGTTTIQSGSASVASTGILTMSGAGATLAAGGFLTLNSDINGSASVAAIPAGCSITGNVNVQRFITGGGLNYRGYRLLSSPVYGSTNGTSNIYSINYLINSVYLKGQAGVPGGWDAGGNPNVYLFRENLASSNAGFSAGNFRSINTLGFAPNFNYLVDNDPGTFNIPAGDGFMFFFRGDRNVASLTAETTVSYIPTNTILTSTGTLNQGTVTVSDWYTPASTNLGWTTTAGNASVQGYNLVGNPYASSIDWDQYMFSAPGSAIYAPNVNPFIYIIDPVNGNYNVYQAGTGGVGTIVSSNSNIIPSGQGFFVQASSAAAQLVFNESAKVATQANAANGNLLMGHPPMAAAAPVSQYLHLKMLKDTTGVDGIIISFRSNTSNNYSSAEDAKYRNGNGSVSITSMSADNVPLAINSMPLPAQTKQTIIPLNVTASTDGTAQIQMAEIKSIPALFTIWLKDAYKKDSLDIRANPTYTFDILHSDTNTYGSHRFTLVMGENPALMIHLLSFGASKIQGGDQVVWTTENEQNYTNFTVERSTDGGTTFNALGGFQSSAQSAYSYLDKVPVDGPNMYRLKIVDLNGTISYSNVVTIMYANTNGQIAINGMMVYPNPTAGNINLSITSKQTNGTGTTTAKPNYNIEIVNNLGTVIKSSQSNSPLWQSDVTALTPGTYFIRVIDNSSNTVVGKSAFVKL